MKELSEYLEIADNEVSNAWEAHHRQEARAEKAEARVAELEARWGHWPPGHTMLHPSGENVKECLAHEREEC